MRELRITDEDLQALIADGLRKKLKAAGFNTVVPSSDHAGFFFPVNLSLAGECTVTRHEDGTWTITQEDNALLADRTDDCLGFHAQAVLGNRVGEG